MDFEKTSLFYLCITGVYDEIIHNTLMDTEVQCVDMIRLDFSKAFDRADHHILLQKLKCYELTKQLSI